MAFRASNVSRVWLGALPLSCYARNLSVDSPTEMLETTTLCDAARTYIPDVTTGTFSVDGPLDVVYANIHATTLNALKSATSTPFTFSPVADNGVVWLGDALETGLDYSSAPGSTVDWSMNATLNGQVDVNGVILQNGDVTADGSSSNTDNGAATTGGAVAHLHITTMSGITADTVIIEGSANGSSGWATVASFAAATGIGAQRVEVAGSVARYLRVTHDVTGTGTVSCVVSLARR